MIIPFSFPQPFWIFMRKFSWTSKQSKSSDNNSQLSFYFIVYLHNSKLQKSFIRIVFDLSDINTSGGSTRNPSVHLELNGTADLMAACRKCEAVDNPRLELGMLKKNVWKMVVLLMLCAMQVSGETPFSCVELWLTRPNSWFSSTCSNFSACFECLDSSPEISLWNDCFG